MSIAPEAHVAWSEFLVRRKVFTLFSAKFHIYDSNTRVIGFCRQKAFKLREDIRLYADETMQAERMAILARQIIDWSAAYDVIDSQAQQKLGALRRKGWSSLFRDAWEVLDEHDQPIGRIREDSAGMALLRRFVGGPILFPQRFHLEDASGRQLAWFRANRNPFVQKLHVTMAPDLPLHPLVLMAASVLLVAIEGRQQ